MLLILWNFQQILDLDRQNFLFTHFTNLFCLSSWMKIMIFRLKFSNFLKQESKDKSILFEEFSLEIGLKLIKLIDALFLSYQKKIERLYLSSQNIIKISPLQYTRFTDWFTLLFCIASFYQKQKGFIKINF